MKWGTDPGNRNLSRGRQPLEHQEPVSGQFRACTGDGTYDYQSACQ